MTLLLSSLCAVVKTTMCHNKHSNHKIPKKIKRCLNKKKIRSTTGIANFGEKDNVTISLKVMLT